MTRGNTGSARALSRIAQLESARTPRGATTRLKKFIAEDRGVSLIAVRIGRPHPQQRSSNTRFKVAFRASGVVLRQGGGVGLVGSAMMRVGSVSKAGTVRGRWMSVPKRSGGC